MIATGRRIRLTVCAVLLAHAAIVVGGQQRQAVTFNEFAHLPAGIAYWKQGAFELYNVNPPLAKLVAALPAMAAQPALPRRPPHSPGVRGEWEYGLDFLRLNRGDYRSFFRLGRLAIAAFSVAAGWCVYRWSSQLFGDAGGLVSVLLWAFCPNVLASAQLVTPDAPAAALIVVASYLYWRWLAGPSWRRALLAGAALGAAELCKFSALILYPTWCGVWLAAQCWARRRAGAPSRAEAGGTSFVSGAAQLFCAFVMSALVINAGYAFSGFGKTLGELPFRSRMLANEAVRPVSRRDGPGGESLVRYETRDGNRFQGTLLGALPAPLPEQYLLGIDVERCDFENPPLPSYLRGALSKKGWWYFYVYALAIKLPVGTIALAALASGLAVLRPPYRAGFTAELALLCGPALILLAASVETSVAQSVRYVLPAFAPAFVAMGRLGRLFAPPAGAAELDAARPTASTRRRGSIAPRALVAGCLLGNVLSVGAVYPHFLAYFNELVGGPTQGPKHLLFSNFDWGQDLIYLKEWIADHPEARPLGVAYFHFVDPAIEGIEYHLPPTTPTPGWYAVSANFVYGMGFTAWDGHGLRKGVAEGAYAYFQHLTPAARAGPSIHIFHVTPADADRVRREIADNDGEARP
ncbi:MAG TPA: glycosyltransferase family 39 protein [Pirellulales bacterium]|nr:glycosyltransferase family 39 protein [Pirellulales bacterium]